MRPHKRLTYQIINNIREYPSTVNSVMTRGAGCQRANHSVRGDVTRQACDISLFEMVTFYPFCSSLSAKSKTKQRRGPFMILTGSDDPMGGVGCRSSKEPLRVLLVEDNEDSAAIHKGFHQD
jgi:hypothetical protein